MAYTYPKKINSHVVILVIVCLNSCTSRDTDKLDYTIKLFSNGDVNKQKLAGQEIIFPEFLEPRRLLIMGNHLIVSDKAETALLHVIDIKKQKYVKSLGKLGEGPGEMGGWASRLLPGVDQNQFWAYVPQRKQLLSFFLSQNSQLAHNEVRQKEGDDFFLAIDMAWSTDSTLMTLRSDGYDKFVEYNLNGQITRTFGTWTIEMPHIPSNVISSINRGALKSNRGGTKFAFAGINRDIIEILDITSGKVISIRGPLNEIPQFEVDNSAGYPMLYMKGDPRYCYLDIFLGEKLIYCLYSGQTNSQIRKTNNYANDIYVFNYNGDLVSHFELDISAEAAIAVDEIEKKIFTISHSNEPTISVFLLPD